MTREEAIEVIKKGEHFSELFDEEWKTAKKMAIEALKASPREITWVTNNEGEGIAFKDMPIEKVNKILLIIDDEPCEDAVSREAVIAKAKDEAEGMDEPFKSNFAVLVEWLLDKLPPVTPKQRTGKWINAKVSKLFSSNDFKCSECGNILNFDGVNCGRGDANFCPNCGAKMKGENE